MNYPWQLTKNHSVTEPRKNRFFIIGQMLIVVLPMLLAVAINILLVKWQAKVNLPFKNILYSYEAKLALVFLLTGLSASLPIIISPRQALPYLLPSIPFFSISIGIVLSFFFYGWWEKFMLNQKNQ